MYETTLVAPNKLVPRTAEVAHHRADSLEALLLLKRPIQEGVAQHRLWSVVDRVADGFGLCDSVEAQGHLPHPPCQCLLRKHGTGNTPRPRVPANRPAVVAIPRLQARAREVQSNKPQSRVTISQPQRTCLSRSRPTCANGCATCANASHCGAEMHGQRERAGGHKQSTRGGKGGQGGQGGQGGKGRQGRQGRRGRRGRRGRPGRQGRDEGGEDGEDGEGGEGGGTSWLRLH